MKSIFRRKEYEKLYYVGVVDMIYNSVNYYMFTRGTSIIKPDQLTKHESKEEISDNLLGEYDIDLPLLEVGDEFYLHDIQELVKIKSRTRGSDNSITYYVEDRLIETENTTITKKECDDKVTVWNHEEERYEKLKKEFDDYKEKYKFAHRFLNITSAEKQS